MKENEEGLEARPGSDKEVEQGEYMVVDCYRQEEADVMQIENCMQVDGCMQVENDCMQAEKDQNEDEN